MIKNPKTKRERIALSNELSERESVLKIKQRTIVKTLTDIESIKITLKNQIDSEIEAKA